MSTAEEINALLEPATGWRVEIAVAPHDQSEFLLLYRSLDPQWGDKEVVGVFPRESPVGVMIACGHVARHYYALGKGSGETLPNTLSKTH